ncbi:MAG: ArsR family transcriptional regulator [Micrococcales bacterium]|nr:ArsR family transcriptional regulator [Micrococcales bacterium]MCL2667234.1 ArsR family transcriptional regulator [Micrococcales bacterium]
MRTSASALVPFLRSDVQARLLAELVLWPDREMSVSDLAVALDVGTSTVWPEVERLTTGGVLAERRVGRSRMLRANPDYRYLAALRQILVSSYGPAKVLADHLRDIPGIDEALIFGSYAARHHGEPGPAPRDLDVLVVGTPTGRAVRRAEALCEENLGVPVQITVVTGPQWHDAASGLVRQIQSAPTVPITLEPL